VRLAIDIDSTLHPYWDQLAALARRRYGVELPYETQATWAIDRLAPEPYPGAVEAIAHWHAQGHFIHITSHRAADAHPHTAEWLDQIGLPHHDLYCSDDKITRCVELRIDVLIDDSPDNLRRAAAVGITAATLEHPWNRDLPDVISAPDWPTLARRLEPHLHP
jgi:FMN phosphatase YigB (HAD superfamily)